MKKRYTAEEIHFMDLPPSSIVVDKDGSPHISENTWRDKWDDLGTLSHMFEPYILAYEGGEESRDLTLDELLALNLWEHSIIVDNQGRAWQIINRDWNCADNMHGPIEESYGPFQIIRRGGGQ